MSHSRRTPSRAGGPGDWADVDAAQDEIAAELDGLGPGRVIETRR